MASTKQIDALIQAHLNNDDRRFRSIVLQLAAATKSAPQAERWKRLAEERPMVALPANVSGLVASPRPVELSELTLASDTRLALEEIARCHRARDALRARGLDAPTRLLFTGPPRNGKTSAASALAGLVGRPAYVAAFGSVIEGFLGATGAKLHRLFEVLRSPVVLIIDEIDTIGAARQSEVGGGREYTTITNTLLTLLDHAHEGILVATTNRADLLDPALVGRFDEVIEFTAPSLKLRQEHALKVAAQYGWDLVEAHVALRDLASRPVSYGEITRGVQMLVRQMVLREAEPSGC